MKRHLLISIYTNTEFWDLWSQITDFLSRSSCSLSAHSILKIGQVSYFFELVSYGPGGAIYIQKSIKLVSMSMSKLGKEYDLEQNSCCARGPASSTH